MIQKTEVRMCTKCQQEYEARVANVLGVRLIFGQGMCPICEKKEYNAMVVKEESARLSEVARVRRLHRDQSGIPPLFMNQDFSTFLKGWQDKALKRCQQYAESFPVDRYPRGYESLYLWSSETWGTGKTHLACAIIHRVLDRWTGKEDKGCPRVIFLSEPDLFRRIQATYSFTREESKVRESEDDIIRSVVYADLVVLDDVGKEKRADARFIQRTMFSIIDSRYKNQLPIVITANLNPDGLKEHLESASFDRVWEMAGGKSTRMDGKSFRSGK